MSVQILYQGQDPFSGISPVPEMTLENENLFFGGRWGNKKVIQLRGTITGICSSFESLISGQKALISGFSQDFGYLSVLDDGVEVFSADIAQIANISFPESPYIQILPYTITINSFDSGAFWQYFGVINPKREIQIDDKEDGTYTMVHTISAKGFNTSGTLNSLENAKAFVAQYTGLTQTGLAQYFSNCLNTGVNLIGCLTSRAENMNRFDGTYSVVENYRVDPSGVILGLTRYVTDVNTSLQADFTTVNVKGDVTSCLTGQISNLRNYYQSLDIYGIAEAAYFNALVLTGLNPIPIKSGIVEDYPSKRIDFQVTYNNDFRPNVYFDGDVSFSTDEIKKLTTVSMNGAIRARHGTVGDRFAQVVNFYTGTNFYSYLSGLYSQQGFVYQLYPKFNVHEAAFDANNGEIKIKLDTSDRDSDANFTLSLTPSVAKLVPIALLNGSYQVQQFPFMIKGVYTVRGSSYSGDPIPTGTLLGLMPSDARITDKVITVSNQPLQSCSISARVKQPVISV